MADLSIIRDKDWLFQTLWSAAHSARKGAEVKIYGFRVPLTFIIYKGKPVKCIGCIEGPAVSAAMPGVRSSASSAASSASNYLEYNIITKHVMDDDGDVFSLRNSSARGLNGNAFRYVRWMRSKLIEFQRQFINNYTLSSSGSAEGKLMFESSSSNADDNYDYERLNELYLCTVTYSDGSREDIDLKSFDLLIRNDFWRSQLVLMQGYVPSRSLADCCGAAGSAGDGSAAIDRGAVASYNSNDTSDATSGCTTTAFYKKKAVGFASSIAESSSSSGGDRKTPLDICTSNLANIVKAAYGGGGGSTDSDGAESVITADSSRITSVQAEVDTMHGTYTRYFDSCRRKQFAFLLFSDYVLIGFKNGRREIEDIMSNERMSREMLSATFVVKELLVILQWAQRRGTATYEHFDPTKNGYIDCQGFIDGLEKIGIGVTAQVARCAIQCIAGIGEKHIFKADFFGFINKKSVYDFDELAEYTFGDDENSTFDNLTYKKRKQRRLNKQRNQPNTNVISSKLELDTIITKMIPRLNQSRDQLFHAGDGFVMTYRILNYLEYEAEAAKNRAVHGGVEGGVEEKTAEGTAQQPSSGLKDESETTDSSSNHDNAKCFTLVLVPDLFMTLESLEVRVKRLCYLYPRATVVLVGLPGMPNTVWPRGYSFSSKTQAAYIDKLIDFLDRKQRLSLFTPPPAGEGTHSYQSEDNSHIFLAAFGSGVLTMSRYVTEHLAQRSRTRLRLRVKFIATINGKLQHDYSYKKICKGLLDLLSCTRFRNDSASPVHDLIMSLHFSEAYLSRNDHEKVFEQFWQVRRALHTDIFRGGSVGAEQHRTGYVGLQEMLRGILYPPEGDSFDGRDMLEAVSTPIVVVQSTEDLFNTPEYAVMFKEENLPATRSLVDSIEQCGSNAVALLWLGAGHEVLVERNPFVLSLFSSFAKMHGVEPENLPFPADAEPLLLLPSAPEKKVVASESSSGTGAPPGVGVLPDGVEEVTAREVGFSLISRTALRQKEKMDRSARRRAEVAARMRTVSFAEEEEEVVVVGVAEAADSVHRDPVVLMKDSVDELRMRVDAAVRAVGGPGPPATPTASVSMLADLQGSEEGVVDGGTTTPGSGGSVSPLGSSINSPSSTRSSVASTRKSTRSSAFGSNSRKSIREDRVVETREERNANRRQKEAEESVIAEEKRRMAMKQQRQKEIAELRERARVEAERKAELKELRQMSNEEARCRRAWVYAEEMRVKAYKLELARKKAEERSARKQAEAERKRNEERRLYRIARLRERRQYVDTLAKSVRDFRYNFNANSFLKNTDPVRLSEDLEPTGKEGDSQKIIAAVSTAMEALNAAWLDKLKLIEVMVCSDELGGKMATYKKRVEALDTDTKRLERAIVLLKLNPSLVGLNDGQHEIEDLTKTINKKNVELKHLKGNYRERVHQLESFKIRAYHFKQIFEESAKVAAGQVTSLNEVEHYLTHTSRELKTRLDRLAREKERVLFAKKSHRERLKTVEAETTRIKNHSYKYVDTNIWVEGANSRTLTEELRKHLTREKSVYMENIRRASDEIEKLGSQIDEINTAIATNKKYQVLLSQSRRYFKQAYAVYGAIEPEKISSELFSYLADTIRKEKTREKARLLAKQAATIGAVSDIDVLRMKDMELRTEDERRFIGMDLVLNPHAYQHLKMRDIEEMRIDPAYAWNIKKNDMERIYKLPDQVGLALPFLYTKEEVLAHRLINSFIRGVSEEDFRARDRESEDAIDSFNDGVAADGTAADGAAADGEPSAAPLRRDGKERDVVKDANDGETANFIALKESQAYSSRCNTDRSALTAEERRWLLVDRVMSPHLYLDVSGMAIPGSRDSSPTGSPSLSPLGSPLGSPVGSPISGIHRKFIRSSSDGLSRERLLELYYDVDTRSPDDYDEETRELVAVLDNYYVGIDESTVGFARVKCLCDFSRSVFAALSSIEGDDEHASRVQQQQRSNAAAATTGIKRVWGSWEEVHPASAGKDSQREYFFRAACNVSRDHPAAFAIHPAREEQDGGQDGGLESFLLEHNHQDIDPSLAFKALLALPGTVIADGLPSLPNKKKQQREETDWFIARNLEELSSTPKHLLAGKVVLVELEEKQILFEERSAFLGSRASRSYKFEVSDKEDSRVLNFTVSIIFQGEFNGRGYSLGRMAAGLFRAPGRVDKSKVPVPVGYCPYELQQPNTPDGLGRIAILHFPRKVPFTGGTYQLVLGCAANTRFSIEVSATVGKVALSVIDTSVEKAKSLQSVLPRLVAEMNVAKESIYLAERKLAHCKNLISEAQAESELANKYMKECVRKIQQDDEEMILTDEERRALEEDSRAYTYDYGYWTKTLSSRSQEEVDIGTGLATLKEQLAALDRNVAAKKAGLGKLRKVIPPSLALVRSFTEACQVAQSLNADVDDLVLISGAENSSSEDRSLVISTPAEAVRRKHKDDGFDSLILEEQQWTLLDQSLNPDKYEWRNAVEDDKKKTIHYSAAVEMFRLSKVELEQLMMQPTAMLSRHQMVIRKLLMKYHDDPTSMKKQNVIKAGFDPHLAERVRVKSYYECTVEEKEWIGVDRILHPEIWAFVTNSVSGQGSIDRHAELATVGGVKNRVNEVAEALEERQREAQRALEPPSLNGGKLAGASTKEAKKKVAAVQKLGKIMGIAAKISEEAEEAVGLDVTNIAATVRLKAQKKARSSGVWVCNWPRERILEVWRVPKHHLKLEEEKKVSALLHRFNGTYASYAAYSEYARKRQLKAKLSGSHIRHNERAKNLSKDTDLLVRQIYRELQRIQNTSAHVVDTDVLQGNNQRFPRELLQSHLDRQLDYYLIDQIKDRERSSRYEVESSDEEVSSDDEGDMEMKKYLKKMKKKAILRANPTLDSKRDPNDVTKVKKQKSRSVTALAEQALAAELGPQGCIACRSIACRWETAVDMDVCTARINLLSMEIERVRNDKESQLIESSVALSAMLGGNSTFLRLDLLYELNAELTAVQREVNLNAVDKELHDAYSSLKESMEVKALHGYPMLLWVNNARVALEQRQSRLCAEVVAHEICEDILDWMLEGWYFGERTSDYTVMGYIPSMKKGSKIRAGLDQVKYAGVAASRLNRRHLAQKHNYLIDEQRRGVMADKAQFVERHAQARLEAESLKKDFEANDHSLNVVENTLRYFIFTCTLMYFRSMALITREKKSWSDSDSNKKVTTERLRMISEDNNYAARVKRIRATIDRARRGEKAKYDREVIRRRDAIMRKVKAASERHRKDDCARIMQRVYRGYIGRRNAKIWAVKRAELEAMNALLHQTAIIIQRTYRRYLASVLTDETRKEMAQFIAFLRDQEAKQDEEQYWQTHNYKRRRRDAKELYDKYFLPKRVGEARDGGEDDDDDGEEVGGYDLSDDDDDDDDDEAAGEATSVTIPDAAAPEAGAQMDEQASAKVPAAAAATTADAKMSKQPSANLESTKRPQKKPAAPQSSFSFLLNPFSAPKQQEPSRPPAPRKAQSQPSQLFRKSDARQRVEDPLTVHTKTKITHTLDAEEMTISVQQRQAGDDDQEDVEEIEAIERVNNDE